ncbi:MAG: transglutaminase family protein [Bacteroidota bacterium]|nr:transglutaminase family protein [Bacteroidota bacterium]
MEYTIKYKAVNTYDAPVDEAFWQFLLRPEENDTQRVRLSKFSNSINAAVDASTNTFGFPICRVHLKKAVERLSFEANYIISKNHSNPFSALDSVVNPEHTQLLNSLDFKIEHERFLGETSLTTLNREALPFKFSDSRSIFDNLNELNAWIYKNFEFKTRVTDVTTTPSEFLAQGAGVCQDFTHLFLTIARLHQIPARYTSGYLHQGNGYKGDSQMHAWAECYIPEKGWLGFDPANNLIALENHIKVAHGRDYADCAPIKGIIYSNSEKNETNYVVEVQAREESEPDVFMDFEVSEPLPFAQQLAFQSQWQQQQYQQQQQLRQQQNPLDSSEL